MKLYLPWPPSALSPNARVHWAVLSRHKNKLRQAAKVETTLQKRGQTLDVDAELHMTLIFVRPNKRSYDRDNLVARAKAAIDGMCDALSIDDRIITKVTAAVAVETDRDNPGIHVLLESCHEKTF